MSGHCVCDGVGPSVDGIWDQLQASEARLGRKKSHASKTGRTLVTETSDGDSDGGSTNPRPLRGYIVRLSQRSKQRDH